MSNPNPTLLSQTTRFPPTTAYTGSPTRSLSRSPLRKAHFTAQEIDPLLDNLSPGSTIKALSVTEALSTSRPKDGDILGRSIAEASLAERAYGVRAAVAAQKLREWHTELQGWKWPAPKDRRLGNGFQQRGTSLPRAGISSSTARPKEYAGSLPTTVVAQHEERIEAIRDGLEALNVEELKEHVLNAHARSSSERTTANGMFRGVVQLSDFTAVITQTMLQALPYLAKLTALLDDWDARITVLMQIPHLLRQLSRTEMAIESAAQHVCSPHASGTLTRISFEGKKAVLGSDVSRLGATFDKMLDLLEGREDSLPDLWVHRMDKLEANFAQWAVEAERMVLKNEWTEHSWASTPRRNKNSQPSNVPNGATVAGKDLSSINPQAQSATGSEEEVKRGSSARLESKQFRSRNHVRADLTSKGDGYNTSSAGVGEDHPTKSDAVLTSPLPSYAEDGWPLSIGPQSVLPSTTTAHGATSLPVPRAMDADLSHVTSQEPRTSLIATNDTTTGRGLNVNASAKDRLEIASQPHMLARSVDDGSHANSDALDQPGAAASDDMLASTKLPQQNSPAADRNPGRASIETPSKFLPRRANLPSGHQSSALIKGSRICNPSTMNSTPTNHHKQISESSVADSALSEPFTDLSTAEIIDATTAAAPGSPRIVSHAARTNGDDLSSFLGVREPQIQSTHLERWDISPADTTGKGHGKAATISFDKIRSSCALPVKTSDTVINDDDDDEDDDPESSHVMVDPPTPLSVRPRRAVAHEALISSMEKIPQDELRGTLVKRIGSFSSSIPSPISPLDPNETYTGTHSARSVSPLESGLPTPSSREFLRKDYFQGVERNEEDAPSRGFRDWQFSRTVDDHIDSHGITRQRSKPLDSGLSTDPMTTWSKESKELAVSANSAHDTQDTHSVLRSWSTAPTSITGDGNEETRTPSGEKDEPHKDLLESKIQSLLTRIPARIRLLSESEPGSPTLPSNTSSRSQSPIPSIILSPVKSKRYLQTSRNDNSDVRLFHLSRTTESRGTPPTKLFVRLVGEHGERVMVRVGGGWADLGDYLRDYSLHRSKHGFNDGQFELASMSASGQQGRKDGHVIRVRPELISKAKTADPVSNSTLSIHPRLGSATDDGPSAVDPFRVLRPTMHRRSTSAMQQSRDLDPGRSSSVYAFQSDVDNIHMGSDTPPVPSIPQTHSLNPYYGDDPRSNGPPRQPYTAVSPQLSQAPTSSHDQPLKRPTPKSTSSSQQRRHHNIRPDSAGKGSAKSRTAKQPKTAETKSRSTTPAASRTNLDPADIHTHPDIRSAPASSITRTYLHSSPVGPSSITASPVPGGSPLSGPGGIRRVFFRKKGG